MSKKPSDVVQVKVRMREDLRRKIERAAQKNGLTINAEILRRVDQTFDVDLDSLERGISALGSLVEGLGTRFEVLGSRLDEYQRSQQGLEVSRKELERSRKELEECRRVHETEEKKRRDQT